MFIMFNANGEARIEEPDNFRAFRLVWPARFAQADSAIAAIGRRDGAHVWVDRDWLLAHGRPDDAGWVAGLHAMLGYAASAGWVDGNGAIRAHIDTG